MHINIDHDAPSALILDTDRRNASIPYWTVSLHSPKSSHLAASSCLLAPRPFSQLCARSIPIPRHGFKNRLHFTICQMHTHAHKLCEKRNEPACGARETSKPTNTLDTHILCHYLCRNDVLHGALFAFICRMMYRHVYFINIHTHRHGHQTCMFVINREQKWNLH